MTTSPDAERIPSGAGTDAANEEGSSRGRSGLLARIAVGLGGLAVALVVVFALLIVAVLGLRHRSLDARHSQQVLATANGLQTLVVDFETGLRGFVITNDDRYLDPWRRAQMQYPGKMRDLIRLTVGDLPERKAAVEIRSEIDAYLTVYTVPLVKFMSRNPVSARAVVAGGARRVVGIRKLFASFVEREQARAAARDHRARVTAHRAVLVGGIGLGVALGFLLGAAAYLYRAVARPVQRAARASQRVSAGDLSTRLPTGGPGEVGQLERSFNAMADSLQRNRDDLEERNRQLVESEQLKTELVSNVSHELRTPLASVLGFSDLMLKRDVAPDDRRRYLELIRSEAARLATLLNDLLDLQRHERGVVELVEEEVDLNRLLEVQVTLYSAQSELHGLVLNPSPDPVIVRGDPDRLAQVIGNLLSNAIKYSPGGGQVDVTASVNRGEAWVWVRDRGFGIPADHQGQIFTKFFRGDAARKRGISGTGLGLVLARQIVEAHGGTIGFDSDERAGSTFWIRLPAIVSSGSASAAGDGAEARHGV
jgi:signal transduction histidine kinase